MSNDSEKVIIEDYTQGLNELTFPSTPVIANLTLIAKENTQYAEGITNAIINRIYKCLPEYKLFALFLVDSICRNVGSPYNILFGEEIFKLYSHVYLLASDEVRQKMANMFEIWRTTKTKGTDLPMFPEHNMDKISKFLEQAQPKQRNDNEFTIKRLIADIDAILPLFERTLAENPDPKLVEKFRALNDLKNLLQSQSITEASLLLQVEAQLHSIKDQFSQISSNKNTKNIKNNPRNHASLPPVPQKKGNIKKKVEELFKNLVLSNLVTVEQNFGTDSQPSYTINFPKAQSLQNPQTVDLASYSVLEQLVKSNAKLDLGDPKSAKTEFERLEIIQLSTLNLESVGLQNFINSSSLQTSVIELLYGSKPSKCAVCGKRFGNDDDGATKRRMHLDWHFRVNKKLNTKHVQSRVWYLDDIEWVKFKDEELLEYYTPTAVPVASTDKEVETKKEIPFVTIPPNETNMNNKCQICRDNIKATYNDDLGEWCWYDCIRVPSEKNARKIVHAACFKEAKKRNAQDDLNVNIKRERI